MDRRIVGALRGCETQAAVEDIFTMFKISDLASKSDYLIESMGSPEVFYAGKADNESRYATNLSAILTGEWRIYLDEKAAV